MEAVTREVDAEQRLIESIATPVDIFDASIEGINIHYARAGTGPPLVLLHGATVGWGQWHRNIDSFSQFYTVYALDLPGCGRSSAINFRNFNIENDFVRPVRCFVELQGMCGANVIAHSIGGWVALKMVQENSSLLDKLVLADPLGFGVSLPLYQRLAAMYPIAYALTKTKYRPNEQHLRGFLEDLVVQKQEISSELVRYYAQNIRKQPHSHPLLLFNGVLKYYGMRRDIARLEGVREVVNPALLVRGNSDPIVSSRGIQGAADQMPFARYISLERAGHAPFIEQPNQFNDIALSFLRDG